MTNPRWCPCCGEETLNLLGVAADHYCLKNNRAQDAKEKQISIRQRIWMEMHRERTKSW
ncbi:hypothetical protein LCGC14_1453190 [marine sediment metagenome]|uniref:Uncharacterized protein n=1 Tax=marine sediment metagenome TaxID=412755 RepID=A0A0F9LXU7_9ZZZZ